MYKAVFLPLSFAALCFITGILVAITFHPLLLTIFIIGSVIFLADARGRYRDWLYLSIYWKENPSRKQRELKFKYYGRTACGRQVVIAVYPYLGKQYYKERGYRWYHLLPDNSFSRSSPFFQKQFWINLIKGQR